MCTDLRTLRGLSRTRKSAFYKVAFNQQQCFASPYVLHNLKCLTNAELYNHDVHTVLLVVIVKKQGVNQLSMGSSFNNNALHAPKILSDICVELLYHGATAATL